MVLSEIHVYPVKSCAGIALERARSEGGAFFNRIRKNQRIVGKWARREGVSCYRLYDADIPEYAVAV
ncbi:MAG: hypothetical protein B0D86_04425, partial [Candidatus Sedimenticola endophacoides]